MRSQKLRVDCWTKIRKTKIEYDPNRRNPIGKTFVSVWINGEVCGKVFFKDGMVDDYYDRKEFRESAQWVSDWVNYCLRNEPSPREAVLKAAEMMGE